ncbi:MAG: polyribonucleotide nucleotidyltransferase [Acidobacteriota bacterium]
MVLRESVEIGGCELTIEMGKLARQADGAAVVSYGDTTVLVTACAQRQPKDIPFLPLTCDYREYTYAGGRIPGGFFKREGRPTEREILTARMTDRPIRPLFPDGYSNETQVIGLVLSADGENSPDILSITGASTALYCSPIPFSIPIAAVRVGLVDGELVLNPTNSQLAESKLDLVVAGRRGSVVMLEAGANEVAEEDILKAVDFAQPAITSLIDLQQRLYEQLQPAKRDVVVAESQEAILEKVEERVGEALQAALRIVDKIERRDAISTLKTEMLEALDEEESELRGDFAAAFSGLVKSYSRRVVLDDGVRRDGRAFDEVRPISCEVGISPRVHGSALFTRGETQAFVSSTLGTADDAKKMENYDGEWWKKFLLHYNFPPFSVGEVRWMRGPGRREIGHGALAERAIKPILPTEEEFPYVIRTVSDILESNGSSSMATVCGATLSLMDAGVPILGPVAGIAMGLMKEGDKIAVLSDIAGEEDHYGDMDLKVAGTPRGITALQMDIKVEGLSREIFAQALQQARENRMHILRKMSEAIAEPRKETSRYAPRILTIKISVDRIRDIIGPGGRIIRSIQEDTGCRINVEDDGTVQIAAMSVEAGEQAMSIIEGLTEEAKVGKVYRGKVRSIKDFGAFVEILPGTDGLLHISEVADHHVKDVRDHMQEGDELLVKVINIDERDRVRLSLKALTEEERETADHKVGSTG